MFQYIKIFRLSLAIFMFLCCTTHTLLAQQDSQFTQYMYNTEAINPAYAGSKGHLSFVALYRSQWVGLDGAPKTGTFTVNSPIDYTEKIGMGLSFVQDAIGPSNESNIAIDFAYSIFLDDYNDLKLAFGLKGGVSLLNVDYTKLNIYNPNDNLQQNNIENKLKPLIGVGVYLYDSHWYAGISSPNLLRTKYYNEEATISYASEEITAYFMGGYIFQLSEYTKFKPAFLTKITSGSPLAIDVSANFLFNDTFTLGGAYRVSAAISALAGFQISENIMIGYAYDYGTEKLANYNSGSHELFLTFDLFRNSLGKVVNPRFF